MIRRLAGVAALTAALGVAAACGPAKDDSAGSSGASGSQPSASAQASADATTAPADASADFSAALKKTANSSFKLRQTTTGSGTSVTQQGSFDPATKSGEVAMTVGKTDLVIRIIGTDAYMKGFPGVASGGWVHMDLAAMSKSGFNYSPDGSINAFTNATDVTRSGNSYTGKIDTAKLTGGLNLSAGGASASPAVPKNVPFTATVNDQGYVDSLKMTIDTAGTSVESSTEFSDFGVSVDVEKPAKSQDFKLPTMK